MDKGLGYGTVEFLRSVWFPAVGNYDRLLPEWESRDFGNGYRYLDLAYMPGAQKEELKYKATVLMRETSLRI
ncbi:hypothetical protein J2T14_000690 [Paenibacillus harenae]|nr:hypothetical protein [Paenibacillus harenae]